MWLPKLFYTFMPLACMALAVLAFLFLPSCWVVYGCCGCLFCYGLGVLRQRMLWS